MPAEHLHAVPHLTTALTGPLQQIETLLLTEQTRIETWLRAEWRKTPAPLYTSVDLRNAGFKLSPVDTNLFPAGFNNLNPAFLPLCVLAMQTKIEQLCETASNILLIPEDHSRNLFYLESLATLRDIILKAGYQVRIGSLRPDLKGPEQITLPSGRQIQLDPLIKRGRRVGVADYDACLVILNNDLISGIPEQLQGIEQNIVPPPGLGWSSRLKSGHFKHFNNVATEFAKLLGIDPWLINPLFRNCGELDFKKREGEDCLVRNVEALLESVQKKYDEYGIDKPPFVVIKADAGTYGMGIISVSSIEEVQSLNRKQRSKMASMKGGASVSKVILQEGVYTFETWGAQAAVAEPVVYMIDHFVVGGFYRVHTGRGINENLNAPGMHFEPLAFVESCNTPDRTREPDAEPNRFYAYGVLARLALLAAARELAEHNDANEAQGASD
ncbi:MAG: glutamate--cysteine ligase [Gammaproteobacteria bacterium]|nr:glutamate--cysteine ligase [Gammaproteobacteria bacterium]MBU2479316.1 glutamate--cysteine ligase [Gammaproteobacteria bacterium]